jgi:hypothetical protein
MFSGFRSLHDSGRVRRRQPAGDLGRDVDRLPHSEPGAAQRLAVDELAHDVALADVVHGNDVGVAQGGDGAGLDLESLPACRIRGDLGRQDLERDIAVQAGIVGTINLTHPPGTYRRNDLVGPEACAGRERRERREGHAWGSVAQRVRADAPILFPDRVKIATMVVAIVVTSSWCGSVMPEAG